MPASHASYVYVEEIDSGQRCTLAVASDTLMALLETWCDHELQWVLYETNTPPLWTQLSDICAATLRPYRSSAGGGNPGRPFS